MCARSPGMYAKKAVAMRLRQQTDREPDPEVGEQQFERDRLVFRASADGA